MKGKTYVMRNGRLVEKCRAAPLKSESKIHVISDELSTDLEHHGYADGRRTSSKSVYRKWTKGAGLIEKGNDRERPKPIDAQIHQRQLREDIRQAVEMVKQGYRPTIGREW